MVPNGWLKTNFGAVTEIANGQVDPKVEPYLNMLHIGPENVVSDSGQIVDVVTCKESSLISGKYEFDENAIVYSKIRPNLNKVCRPGFKGVCSADMYPIWAKSELDIEFLLHYMLGPLFYKVAVAMSMRTGMPKINRSDLNTVALLLPPVDEQKKIAQILTTWDKAITTTEQMLANSHQQKKSLMQQLLTGKKRLLDKNGVRFSGEWKVYQLGDWIKEFTEKSICNDQYEVLTSSRSGLVKQSEYFADSRISQRENVGFNILPPGYMTYRSRSDDGQFFFNRNDFSFSGIISTYYPVFHFPDGDTTFFLNYLNRSASAFSGYSVGTSQKVLSLNALKTIKAKLPSQMEQQKIASVLTVADQEITTLQQKLNTLKQEKKALMQQLLTGKRRVLIN